MDIERVKQAFIKADDLAQKGDQTAMEDAKYFANIIKNYKPQEERTVGKSLMGGAAAVGDFVANMIPDTAAGIYGLSKGALDAATTDKSFMDAGADAVRAAQEAFGRNYVGKATGTEGSEAYNTAEEALATPAAAGTMSVQGLAALGRLPFEGLDKTVQGLEEPWRNPVTSTIADTAGPLLGYGLAGRGAKAIGDATVQVKPFQRPEPIAEPLPETKSPLEYPRKAIDGPLKEGEDPTAFYPEGFSEPPQTTPDIPGVRRRRPQNKNQEIETIPFEPAEGATWQGREIERPTRSDLLEDSAVQSQRRHSERDRMEAWERDANEQKRPEDIDQPITYGLSLEDRPLREEGRLNEKDAIERGREDFPTVDIDLLPERVAKDSVVKGLITRWNNVQAKLRELYQKANETGLEGTRVRSGEVGTTKKAKGEINSLRESISTLEKKLNNLSQQLQNRMTNRHGVDVEGLPLFTGVKEKGVTEDGRVEYTGGKYAEEAPSVAGPAERTTGLTVEKTDAANMQRSPDAKVTGSEMVQKTQRPALGRGPGGRQSGGIDLSVVPEAANVIKKAIGKFEADFKSFTELLKSIKIHNRDVIEELTDYFEGGIPTDSSTLSYVQFEAKNIRDILKEANYPKEIIDAFDKTSKSFEEAGYHQTRNAIRQNFTPEQKQLVNLSSLGHRLVEQAKKKIEEIRERHGIKEDDNYSGNNRAAQFQMRKISDLEWKADNLADRLKYADRDIKILEQGGSPYHETRIPETIKELDTSIAELQELLNPQRKLNKGPWGKQSGGLDLSGIPESLSKLFGKGNKPPSSRPAPKAGTPITRYMLEDTRDLATFVKEEFPRIAEWKDLSDGIFQKIVQGKFVASMARNLNPVAQFLTSKVVSLDRMAAVAKENALHGSQFASNLRGWSKRMKSADGVLTYFNSAKKMEARKVHEALIKFDNADELVQKGLDRPTEQMLRAEGLNDAQVKAANAVYDQIGKLFDEVNKLLTDAGKDPIQKLPGYIPHMWFGDYRVILKDRKTGQVLDVRGVNTRKQVEAMKAEMKKKFGDESKYSISDFDTTRTKYKANDVSAFQYALSILSKGSPEHKLMNSVYKDIVAHRGFKTHGLQRKGAKGFAGSELTDSGLKDFTKALESYFNHGYNFIANQKKKQIYSELKKELDKAGVELPNTRKFVDEYVEHSTGGMKSDLKLIDDIIRGIGERTGMGPGAIGRGLDNMNALGSAFMLSSVKFLAVNTVQPLYNWAKLRNIQLDFGGSNPTTIMAKAMMETFLGKASAQTKAGLSWAKQNGYIDSKTIDLLNTKALSKNIVNEAVYHGAKKTLGWWEQEAVRTPTFVMYDLALRDVIKDNKQRWETAGALTDKYMVDYGKSESPFFYDKAGLVGSAVRPFKQYGHAYYGQLGEYVKLAMEDKQYSPLAGFAATQAALGGIKGLPLVGTASALITAINNYFGSTYQTPEDIVLGWGASDDFVFGPLSTSTGLDLSGSVSAPGIEDAVSTPGLSFALQAGAAAAMFTGKMSRGTVTDADVMKTIPKLIPNPHVKALTEKAFTKDGVVPDPNNRMLPKLTNPRTGGEEMARILTGAQLTREQGEKAVINSIKREEQADSKVKKEVMDKLIDDYVKGQASEDELVDRYQKHGGDIRNFLPEVKSHLKGMLMGQLQRNLLNSKGMSQAQKIEKLKKYDQILSDAGVDELVSLARD